MLRNSLKIALIFFFVLISSNASAQVSSADFVIKINTTNNGFSDSNSYYINTDNRYSYNFDVDWNNDGIFDSLSVQSNIIHRYASPGIKTIRIRGNFPSLKFGDRLDRTTLINQNDRDKLISIEQWGDQVWRNVEYGFSKCQNLTTTPLDTIDLSMVSSIRGMFSEARLFNGPVNHWDVSGITNMSATFQGDNMQTGAATSAFNQPVNNWDVSSVVDMHQMFASAYSFNQPLNSWDVSSVRHMNIMFIGAASFNQSLDNWSVDSVTSMLGMFVWASSFDQNLSNWDFSSCRNLGNFLDFSGMSTPFYDSLLIHLDNDFRALNLSLGALGLEYCASVSARNSLISSGWLINGDTLQANCQTVGLDEQRGQDFKFYPNPASSILQFDNASIGELFQIHNLQGQLMKEEIIIQENFSMDLSSYENGIYLIRIGEMVEKLVIQK